MIRTLALAAMLLALASAGPAAAQDRAAPAAAPAPAAATPAPATTPAPVTTPAPEGAVPAQPPPPPPAPVAAPAPTPSAQAAPPQQVPLRKRIYTWASVGTTFANGETYGNANLGAGYMMKHGIAPNVELSYMFGNSPTIWALRPGVTWYSKLPLKPYVGAYYTHWFVGGDLPDQNGVGGRLGVSLGRVVSVGVTYDRALNCDKNCDMWTPQVSAGLSL